LIIRDERAGEEVEIAALIETAFREALHTDGTEHAIPAKLRAAGRLSVSLVAEVDGRAIAHVAYSPITISDGSPGWFGLGPVSVLPEFQRGGVGTALIREGLERLLALGARGCVVLGDPAYYHRFGFAHDPRLSFPGPPPEYFLRLVLREPSSTGEVRYAEAFY
jgi:putative acetyltransferase